MRSLHILLVDDHHDSVQRYQHLLQNEGHLVTVAESIFAALMCARAMRFDVILCDIELPNADGCELLAEVRALYPVRAVALTAYAQPWEVMRVERRGFDRVLLKPAELREIREALADASAGMAGGAADQSGAATG